MPQPPRALDPGASPLSAFGAALRERRVAARLSQRELGSRVHVSGALVGKLEKAERRPDADLVRRLDDALDSDGALWTHYARLLDDVPTGTADGARVAPGDRRRPAVGYCELVGLRPAPAPVSAEDLQQALASSWADYQALAFRRVCARAPALLTGARAGVDAQTASGRDHARQMLALSHHVVAATLAKLGDRTLAAISAELGLRAAIDSGDPRVVAALQRCVAHTVLAGSDDEAAIHVAESAAAHLTRGPSTEADDPRTLSLLGSLWLVSAMAAARSGAASEASDYLTQARRLADRQGHDANHCWTGFGPTNTAMHQVSVAVEVDRLDEAAQLAATVPTAGLPRERRVRHTLERARLADLLERPDDAADHLLDAERQAPIHVRRHFITRDLTRRWSHAPNVTRRPDVRQLITRMTCDATPLQTRPPVRP